MEGAALVIQTRVRDEDVSHYADWQAKVGASLVGRPGYLRQEIIPPVPPRQPDWLVIQRFESEQAARDWMQSDTLHSLLDQARPMFVGEDSVTLAGNASGGAEATATIGCTVSPDRMQEFLSWENRMFELESKAPGFLGHKLIHPIEGVQPQWKILLTFDSDANMDRWMASPERKALLDEAADLQTDVQIQRSGYGFDFWFRDQALGFQPSAAKSNLLVLLVLYPIVFLWGYFFSGPFIDKNGAPFWLSLFIGNVVSTQLMGWWVVPWFFRVFDWWVRPNLSSSKNAQG
jgi:antibiotic biosynthesis monooxygenase (ABM) superfamily enzyme